MDFLADSFCIRLSILSSFKMPLISLIIFTGKSNIWVFIFINTIDRNSIGEIKLDIFCRLCIGHNCKIQQTFLLTFFWNFWIFFLTVLIKFEKNNLFEYFCGGYFLTNLLVRPKLCYKPNLIFLGDLEVEYLGGGHYYCCQKLNRCWPSNQPTDMSNCRGAKNDSYTLYYTILNVIIDVVLQMTLNM